MSFFNLLGRVVSAKINPQGEITNSKIRTPAPLNLTQDSAVAFTGFQLVLAEADGSLAGKVATEQMVTAVGKQRIFGLDVYHSYLSDGKSFLRTISRNGTVQELSLFTSKDEIIPQTQADWEFWLGSYQRDSTGEWLRDSNGNTLIAEHGLIGWPQFQVDGEPPIVYTRAWGPGPEGTLPISYNEMISTGLEGGDSMVNHESMEYVRQLGDGPTVSTESLLVTMSQCNGEASINIFVGIQIDPKDIKVLAA